MDAQIFTTVATGAMLAMFTAILAWQGKGRLDTIDRQLDQVRSNLTAQIGTLRSEVRSDVALLRSESRSDTAELRSELAVMRSDLTAVALALGARPRPQTG